MSLKPMTKIQILSTKMPYRKFKGIISNRNPARRHFRNGATRYVGDTGGRVLSLKSNLVAPVCMRERRTVEFILMETPEWHEFVHHLPKTIVVMTLNQVDHLVHDDVFNAGRRLLCKFEIQPNSASSGVAGSPSGLHLSYAGFIDLHAHFGLPLCNNSWKAITKIASVPSIQQGLSNMPVGSRSNAQR